MQRIIHAVLVAFLAVGLAHAAVAAEVPKEKQTKLEKYLTAKEAAEVVARLGWQAFQAGAADSHNILRPLYLRPTEAEVKFGVAETPRPPGC